MVHDGRRWECVHCIDLAVGLVRSNLRGVLPSAAAPGMRQLLHAVNGWVVAKL
jgi:hypothetical protein